MNMRPSTDLGSEYPQLSELAKVTGQPIFITNRGESDLVLLSMEAYEEREQMYRHRDMVFQAELSRLNGVPGYTPSEVDAKMEALFRAYET